MPPPTWLRLPGHTYCCGSGFFSFVLFRYTPSLHLPNTIPNEQTNTVTFVSNSSMFLFSFDFHTFTSFHTHLLVVLTIFAIKFNWFFTSSSNSIKIILLAHKHTHTRFSEGRCKLALVLAFAHDAEKKTKTYRNCRKIDLISATRSFVMNVCVLHIGLRVQCVWCLSTTLFVCPFCLLSLWFLYYSCCRRNDWDSCTCNKNCKGNNKQKSASPQPNIHQCIHVMSRLLRFTLVSRQTTLCGGSRGG